MVCVVSSVFQTDVLTAEIHRDIQLNMLLSAYPFHVSSELSI